MPQRRRLQWRPRLRPHRARPAGDRPAALPERARATKQFERPYKGRTAVERVNGRLKIFWGIDDNQVYGARRVHAHVGAVMVVHLAFATLLAQAARYEGTFGKRTLSPIAKALRELLHAAATEDPVAV